MTSTCSNPLVCSLSLLFVFHFNLIVDNTTASDGGAELDEGEDEFRSLADEDEEADEEGGSQ